MAARKSKRGARSHARAADLAAMKDIARSLLTVLDVIRTCAASADAGAVEHFPDVAQVLRIHAAARLHEQIARLRALAGAS